MAKTGSITDRITDSAAYIATGRAALYTSGTEAMGLVAFNKGMTMVIEAFKDANASNDLQTIIQAQLTYVKHDLAFCNDKYSAGSFQNSITDLQDSLNSLTLFGKQGVYADADKTYSTRRSTDRVDNLPKDVVYKTLTSEITRLANSIKSNMPSPIEREFTLQRMENMRHARELYKQMQKKVLGYVPKVRSKEKELGD
jgi:hypothetical protein